VKLVIAILDSGVVGDVMTVLEEQGIRQWTRWSSVQGAGERNVRQGTPIWPGLNEVLLLVLSPERVQPLVDRCHELRRSFPLEPGMKFIVTDCLIL
jgi:nitrogen regulatory protein PII